MAERASTEQRQERQIPTSIVYCFGVLGLTTGIYAGLSQSPVVGTVITGVLSLLVGGSIALVLGKKDAPPISEDQMRLLANAVICLCLLSLIGAFAGIYLRMALLPALLVGKKEESKLVDLGGGEYSHLPNDKAVKLLLLQTTLDNLGVDQEQNNTMVRKCVDSIRAEKPSYAIGSGGATDDILRYIRESRGFVAFLVEADMPLRDTATEIENVISEFAIEDAERLEKLRLLEEHLDNVSNYRVRNSFEQDAFAAELAVYELLQPELDVIVKHVTTYGSTLSGMQLEAKSDGPQREVGLHH